MVWLAKRGMNVRLNRALAFVHSELLLRHQYEKLPQEGNKYENVNEDCLFLVDFKETETSGTRLLDLDDRLY